MDCDKVQDAMLDVLEGDTPGMPLEKVREHVETCERCRAAAPQIASDWVTVNQALAPEPDEEFWRAIESRVLGMARVVEFPGLQAKLAEYRDRLVRLAAAGPPTEEEMGPLLQRLEVEGEELDVVCHMKEQALLRLSIVDRRTRETSDRLNGAQIRLPSGRSHEIKDGGAEMALQDLIEEIGFTIVKADGTELRVREP